MRKKFKILFIKVSLIIINSIVLEIFNNKRYIEEENTKEWERDGKWK